MLDNNACEDEINKFSALSAHWWRLDGPLRTLHHMNPARLQFIQNHMSIEHARGCDVGCGGGILTEALTRHGAHMTGIDLSDKAIQAAQEHCAYSELNITYQHISSHDFAAAHPHYFDFVTCMELLEHVPEPEHLIQDCAAMTRRGGKVYFSTLNRTMAAYSLAIVGAEYMMGLLPRGTHQYESFIKPAELARSARAAGLTPIAFKGIFYNPLSKQAHLSDSLAINYCLVCEKTTG